MQSHPYAQSGINITWISILANILLASIKCILGLIANSHALLADGLHSLMDLSTDTVALFGFKISIKPEDENHLYGHHKFSSLSTLTISIVILLFCLTLGYASIKSLFFHSGSNPSFPALIAAAASILIKETLYWKTKYIAKKIKSRLLLANAWHHRTDSFSSILVFIAIFATIFGGPNWQFLDSVTGLFIAIYIAYNTLNLTKSSINDLLDTAPEKHIINDIREHILPTQGALAYHKFRVRPVGDLFEVDLHLQVNPNISVNDGHIIASKVKHNILQQHPEVLDVLVHIEPAIDQHIKSQGIHDKDI